MLLVEDSMTREVVTASPRATAYASINVAGVPGAAPAPDRPGSLAGAAGIFGICGVNIISVVADPERGPSGASGERVAVFRVDAIDPGGVLERLREAGYSVLWPPTKT